MVACFFFLVRFLSCFKVCLNFQVVRGDSICFVVEENCEISRLLECSKGIFSSLFFLFLFFF